MNTPDRALDMLRLIRLSLHGLLCFAMVGGSDAKAQDPARVQVRLETKANVRVLSDSLLITDTTIPAGAVVEVPVDEFKGALDLPFWDGFSEQKAPFVKGIRVISAPGFSDADIKRINDWEKTEGVYISKPVLGESIIISTSSGADRYQTQAPTEIYRDDGKSQDPKPTKARKKELDNSAAEDVVSKVQRGNDAVSGKSTCSQDVQDKIVAAGVPRRALTQALEEQAKNPRGLIKNRRYMAITDFTKDSGQKRMFLIDTQTGDVHALYTSNGRGSETQRRNFASHFSNARGSYATPAGFHVTGPTLHNSPAHGKSLLMIGLEAQNSNSASRAILIHSAPKYATDSFVQRYGRVGRSEGCLAIDPKYLPEVLNKLNGGSLIYNYTGQ